MTQGPLCVGNVSEEITEEQMLADISEASFIQFRGCFNVCADYAKCTQWVSSGPGAEGEEGRSPRAHLIPISTLCFAVYPVGIRTTQEV